MYAFSSSRRPSSTGREFIATDTPLGKSLPSTKFIQPTAQYVTEYEANFKWPPRSAYQATRHPQLPTSSEGPQYEQNNNWQTLFNTTKELAAAGHENALMDALLVSLGDHKLNLQLEYANSRLVDQIVAAALHREEHGEYPREVPKDVLALLKTFASAVAAIKST